MDLYEYDDGGGEGRSPARILAALLLVAAIAALGWFVVKPRLSSDDAQTPLASETTAVASSTTQGGSTGSGGDDPSTSVTTGSSIAETTTTATSASASSVAPPTTAVVPSTASLSPSTIAAATPSTTAGPATTTAAAPSTLPVAGYDTLPDGGPVPVVAIFDAGITTLNGVVPDQAAVDRLGGLALANSRDPAATTLVNNLIVNPAVPRNVGVRVIELTSTRFPEASAEILLPHAAELDRVFTVMNALPNVSVLVVGHADQRGNELANFALSEARARSVVSYLAAKGIPPSRLSSRAVGEADLLSINDDAAALALNRRTEFIFYGLLQD